jgi:hypothetical protein
MRKAVAVLFIALQRVAVNVRNMSEIERVDTLNEVKVLLMDIQVPETKGSVIHRKPNDVDISHFSVRNRRHSIFPFKKIPALKALPLSSRNIADQGQRK